MMEKKIVKMFLVCVCSAVFFYSNTAFGGGISDLEGITGQQIDRGNGGGGSSGPSFETQIMGMVFKSIINNIFAPAPDTSVQDEINRQKKIQQQQAAIAEQQRQLREQQLNELVRQKQFNESKDQILKNLKGSDFDTLSLKTGPEEGLRPKGTPFFGLGGGTGTGPEVNPEPINDPMVVDLRNLPKQDELEKMDAAWMEIQGKLIQQRLEEENKWCNALTASLNTKAPPLPYKKFNELQPGDVLLINASGASWISNQIDNALSWDNTSNSSHTVLYLKEENGKKLFLDNQPSEGPRIISEDECLKRYGARGADIAKLAQPLKETEAKKLYTAAVEMETKNSEAVKEKANNYLDKTNYGVWGKDNVVCSESDWALINIARKEQIPQSDDRTKMGLGVKFSPADYVNNQKYFLVTPLDMSK